jgi:hypothetical protein
MKQIENITSEALQRHTIITDGGEIVLVLRYYGITESWFMDLEYNGEAYNGVRLSLAVQHVDAKSWPFDFIVSDSSGREVGPFQLTDFEDDRCQLYMLDAADLEGIRGYDVEL